MDEKSPLSSHRKIITIGVFSSRKRVFKLPRLNFYSFQLSLSGCVIGGANQIPVLVYLPDVLCAVIIQNTTGSSRRECGYAGSYLIGISSTGHVLDTEHVKAGGSGRTHGFAVTGIGVVLLPVRPLHNVDLF
jgi:hypothetical protein